ncbi:MAG: FlgD immunoglobulin-like domain containing protein, partial [Pseudolabrys sp.]
MANGQASWSLNATQPATATVTITAPSGVTAYTATGAVNPGAQTFTWNGVGNDCTQWPVGNYTLTATAVSASGA